MDNTANDNLDFEDLDQWTDSTSDEKDIRQPRRNKKRRKPPRKNRKPSRPLSYIGQRTNNHFLRIFTEH